MWKKGILPETQSWGRTWEPRTKTIAAVLVVFGVVMLKTPLLVLSAFLFIFLTALTMGLPLGFLISRLALVVPFLALMVIPLIFGAGIPPAPDRYDFASLIALKTLTAMLVMIIMLTTQPIQEYLDGLANLKIPPVLISILYLACRYAFLFVGEVKSTQRAMVSRLFNPGINKRALMAYGEMAGGVLVKSIDRSDNVYRAMSARCFNGKMPAGVPKNITSMDLIKTLAAVVGISIVMIIERWWFM